MKAIIIAEHSEFGITPLTERIPHPLLPVAGKTILMHALEVLHRGAVRRVDVVAPSLHQQLREATDTGPLLGMEVNFVPSNAALELSDTHTLVVGLTHILDTDWDRELERLGDLKVHALMPIRMTTCAEPVALLLPPSSPASVADNWSDIHRTDAIHLPIGPGAVMITASIKEYYESNFALLRGQFQFLRPAGREFAPWHRSGPKARVHPDSLNSGYGYFGSNCRIDRTARLSGSVMIGDRAVVAKGTRVRDSIILDRTYLGANTDTRRAIVDRNLLIKVDTGICLRLDDPVLLGAAA